MDNKVVVPPPFARACHATDNDSDAGAGAARDDGSSPRAPMTRTPISTGRVVDRFGDVPTDLAGALLATLIAVVSVMLLPFESLRFLFALPLALFLPGYGAVSALFPARSNAPRSTTRLRQRGVDGYERIVLSFVTSVALLPVLGLTLTFVSGVPSPESVAGLLSVIVLGTTVLGAARRRRLPPHERFSVPTDEWARRVRTSVSRHGRLDLALTVALCLSVVLALGTLGFALAAPQSGDGYAQLSLLTESSNGELVAADYPSELDEGEPASLVVAVSNERSESTEYAVVVQLQRVADDGSVEERDELTRFSNTVDAGDRWERPHQVTPTMTGDRLRLTYLLYAGDPPSEPTRSSADHEVYVWLEVSADE